jgi:hypothetical protein
LKIYQVTGIKILKIIHPSGDAEVVAVRTGPAEAKLEYLVVTLADSGLKSAQRKRLDNAKKLPHALTEGLHHEC